MKTAPKLILGILTMLLMMLVAFGIGAYRGFMEEKLQVDLVLGSLSDVMNTRIEMANNLLTVAKRHLPQDDELVLKIRQDIRDLSGESLRQKAQANERLDHNSALLLKKLEALDSVKADSRDYSYVTGYLPRGFEQSAQWADAGLYNSAARKYNNELQGTLNGKAAMLLGVPLAELFEGGQAP